MKKTYSRLAKTKRASTGRNKTENQIKRNLMNLFLRDNPNFGIISISELTNGLKYSLSPSLALSFARSVTGPFTVSRTPWLSHSIPDWLTPSLLDPLNLSLTPTLPDSVEHPVTESESQTPRLNHSPNSWVTLPASVTHQSAKSFIAALTDSHVPSLAGSLNDSPFHTTTPRVIAGCSKSG